MTTVEKGIVSMLCVAHWRVMHERDCVLMAFRVRKRACGQWLRTPEDSMVIGRLMERSADGNQVKKINGFLIS